MEGTNEQQPPLPKREACCNLFLLRQQQRPNRGCATSQLAQCGAPGKTGQPLVRGALTVPLQVPLAGSSRADHRLRSFTAFVRMRISLLSMLGWAVLVEKMRGGPGNHRDMPSLQHQKPSLTWSHQWRHPPQIR